MKRYIGDININFLNKHLPFCSMFINFQDWSLFLTTHVHFSLHASRYLLLSSQMWKLIEFLPSLQSVSSFLKTFFSLSPHILLHFSFSKLICFPIYTCKHLLWKLLFHELCITTEPNNHPTNNYQRSWLIVRNMKFDYCQALHKT